MHRWSYALVIAAMVAVGQAAFAGPLEPKVVVTVEPLKPYVDEIIDGVGESVSLVRPGQNPHTMVLSPSEAQALAEADVIIMPDQGMSAGFMQTLTQRKKAGAILIELTGLEGADPLPYPKENPWLEAKKKEVPKAADDAKKPAAKDAEEDDDDEKASDIDPHIWLDPLRMATIAQPLADALGRAAPNYQRTFSYNAQRLAIHLKNEVDPALRRMLAEPHEHAKVGTKPVVPFITFHAAYQYFLARYDIAPGGFITQVPEDYLGARSLDKALVNADAVAIRCLISESDSPLVKRIATESGARIVTLNPERSYAPEEIGSIVWVRNGYDRLLYKVAESFAGCL